MVSKKTTRKDKRDSWPEEKDEASTTDAQLTDTLSNLTLEPDLSTSDHSDTPTPMSIPARLFIASVGNPGPLFNTLHSAGHHLVDALKPYISSSHTLYKSSSQMNVSGGNILKAYKKFQGGLAPDERRSARLVIVHDEMELPLGQVKMREEGSLRGHNGLKSVKEGLGGKAFARLGVGIGRPESREPGAVSEYVLRKMTEAEKEKVKGKAEAAAGLLEKLSVGGA